MQDGQNDIKIGITQWCTDRRGPEALYRAKEFGMQGIQIQSYPPNNPNYIGNVMNLKKYDQARKETSVEILSVALTIFAFVNIFKSNKEFVWKILVEGVQAAKDLGVDLVWLPNFQQSEIRNKQDLDDFVVLMQKLFDYMTKHRMDIKIATENTLSHHDNLVLMGNVGNANFQVLLDVFSPVLFGYDSKDYFKYLWNHKSNQIHVKDGSGNQADNERLNQGIGDTDNVINYLLELGFDGYLVLENNYQSGMENNVLYDMLQIEKLLLRQKKQIKTITHNL